MFVISLILQMFRRLDLRQWMKNMNTRLVYVKNLVNSGMSRLINLKVLF